MESIPSRVVARILASLTLSSMAQMAAAGVEALQARDINGDGTIDAYYDSSTNLTWLAVTNAGAGSSGDLFYTRDTQPYKSSDGNARYGKAIAIETRGAGGLPITYYAYADGAMTWDNANAWAQGLDLYGVTGWRLPSVTDLGSPGCVQGQPDCGQVLDASKSELVGLIQGTLGNPAGTVLTPVTPNLSPFTTLPGYGGRPFTEGLFWLGSPGSSYNSWNGYQTFSITANTTSEMSAWAVRTGDVPSIPEPGTFWLAALGLAGIAWQARRLR